MGGNTCKAGSYLSRVINAHIALCCVQTKFFVGNPQQLCAVANCAAANCIEASHGAVVLDITRVLYHLMVCRAVRSLVIFDSCPLLLLC